MRAEPSTKALAIAVVIMVAGCGISDPYVGTGPIALGSAAKEAFADYRVKSYPRYFAVAEDGGAFYYNYCATGRCLRTPKTHVVEQCETYSDGVPCKIYASNGRIVWAKDS